MTKELLMRKISELPDDVVFKTYHEEGLDPETEWKFTEETNISSINVYQDNGKVICVFGFGGH